MGSDQDQDYITYRLVPCMVAADPFNILDCSVLYEKKKKNQVTQAIEYQVSQWLKSWQMIEQNHKEKWGFWGFSNHYDFIYFFE